RNETETGARHVQRLLQTRGQVSAPVRRLRRNETDPSARHVRSRLSARAQEPEDSRNVPREREPMNIHPYADCYPIEPATVEAIAEDMRVNGFDRRHPVIVDAEGRVIDGRTRLAAADAAGVTPHVRKISAQTDAEIADYVRRANDQRRGTMTPYQKMVHMILWAAAAGEP